MYEPWLSVVTVCEVPLSCSVRVTGAPATAAPCGSRTVPRMVPVVTCACRTAAKESSIAAASASERRRFASLIMISPPGNCRTPGPNDRLGRFGGRAYPCERPCQGPGNVLRGKDATAAVAVQGVAGGADAAAGPVRERVAEVLARLLRDVLQAGDHVGMGGRHVGRLAHVGHEVVEGE